MIKTSIIWFKTNLRLADNDVFFRAISESEQVIPVYCFDETHFQIGEFGFKKTGNFRTHFLLESLVDLNRQLEQIGSSLLILQGKPEIELAKLVQKYHADALYAEEEVGVEELNTQALVEKALVALACSINVCHGHNLYYPEDLPFKIENIPDIFTEFRKKVEINSTITALKECPVKISSPAISPFELPTFSSLGCAVIDRDNRAAINFKGGSLAAHERLDEYFFQSKNLSNYKETRNGMIGADYSSKFSAWLSMGCISPREIFFQIKNYESQFGANDSTYWLIFELLWRDYFWLMMKKYGAPFFQLNGIRKKIIFIPNDRDLSKLNQWINGKTANQFINANMQELKLTGFISNRGRQNVASFFCNELQMDWRFGAAYFEQQLIDYDVASNWCNWAYIAGVGNDPRGKRYFNIQKQAEDYDPRQEYRKLWLDKKR